MAVTRGEVRRADLSPTRGSEQFGVRPVLVVQTDRANPHSPHTIIVPFTTRIRQRLLPSHVLVPAGEVGLTQDPSPCASRFAWWTWPGSSTCWVTFLHNECRKLGTP